MSRSSIPDWLSPHRAATSDQPETVETTAPDGTTVKGEFTAIEGMGCAVRGIHVAPAAPLAADVGELRTRAGHLTQALPGGLAIQETDTSAPAILLRSPARQHEAAVEYEEAIVAPDGVHIRRVEFAPETGRQTAELPVTWEEFGTLVDAASRAVQAPAAVP
jgi:hypothetical protein